MPDLPNMSRERDLDGFREYFESPSFRSDGLKIYPTLVIRGLSFLSSFWQWTGTGLYELWKTGNYKNYTPDELVDVVAQILSMVPPWTRVYRIQVRLILTTNQIFSLSVIERYSHATRHLRSRSWKSSRTCSSSNGGAGFAMPWWCVLSSCRLLTDHSVVRTREVGIKQIHHKINPNQVELIRRDYTGNGGWETFLAYEDPIADILVGLLRLRQCSPATFRPEMKDFRCSIVRELHVYGSAVPVKARDPTKFQHQVLTLPLLT